MASDTNGFAISLTFDVEMCTNFPYWTCVWDHVKGCLDHENKVYVGKLADIADEYEVPFHWFTLGRTYEDEDLGFLRRLVDAGHAISNHTYHHVNVLAEEFDQLQVTYRNDPSMAEEFATPLDVIRHEIRKTNDIIEERLGVRPIGFRTPGGFANGLARSPEAQDLLQEEGFVYASADFRYPIQRERRPTWEELCEALAWSLEHLQPYHYPNGLLEIPLMGITDIWAFRVLDLDREEWLRLLEFGIDTSFLQLSRQCGEHLETSHAELKVGLDGVVDIPNRPDDSGRRSGCPRCKTALVKDRAFDTPFGELVGDGASDDSTAYDCYICRLRHDCLTSILANGEP